MSFIFRDGSIIPRGRYNRSVSVYNRFIKYWGTEFQLDSLGNPVEVYSPRRTFYIDGYIIDTVSKNFIKGLGLNWEEFISNNVDKEVETMYFILKSGFKWNGEKPWVDFDETEIPTSDFIVPTNKQISDTINNAFAEDNNIKVTITYGSDTARYIEEHELLWSATGGEIVSGGLNISTIRSIVETNPWYFLANSRHKDYTKNSLPSSSYDGGNEDATIGYHKLSQRKVTSFQVRTSNNVHGVLATLDNIAFTKIGSVKEEQVITSDKGLMNGQITSYSYTQEYIFNGVNESSQLVLDISAWFQSYFRNTFDISYSPRSNDRHQEELTTSMIDNKY